MTCLRSAPFQALRNAFERGVGLTHRGTRVVAQRFGDQLAVGVEVLHPLGGHTDFDVVDVVLGGRGSLMLFSSDHSSVSMIVRRSA